MSVIQPTDVPEQVTDHASNIIQVARQKAARDAGRSSIEGSIIPTPYDTVQMMRDRPRGGLAYAAAAPGAYGSSLASFQAPTPTTVSSASSSITVISSRLDVYLNSISTSKSTKDALILNPQGKANPGGCLLLPDLVVDTGKYDTLM